MAPKHKSPAVIPLLTTNMGIPSFLPFSILPPASSRLSLRWKGRGKKGCGQALHSTLLVQVCPIPICSMEKVTCMSVLWQLLVRVVSGSWLPVRVKTNRGLDTSGS